MQSLFCDLVILAKSLYLVQRYGSRYRPSYRGRFCASIHSLAHARYQSLFPPTSTRRHVICEYGPAAMQSSLDVGDLFRPGPRFPNPLTRRQRQKTPRMSSQTISVSTSVPHTYIVTHIGQQHLVPQLAESDQTAFCQAILSPLLKRISHLLLLHPAVENAH